MPEEPLTPVASERQLRWVLSALTFGQKALAKVRDAEVSAKHLFERARRAAILSAECPKVSRDGYSAAERDAWCDERCCAEREVYEVAKATREAAEDHLRTLREQAMVMSQLNRSVITAYSMAGGG
jgi:hypothetical protein